MANVKHNEDVKNKQDLQNLVVGIIFRQVKPFKDEQIVKIVNHWLKGSKFYDDIALIEKHVEETLDLLYCLDKVRCWEGIHYPRNPITRQFSCEYYKETLKNDLKGCV